MQDVKAFSFCIALIAIESKYSIQSPVQSTCLGSVQKKNTIRRKEAVGWDVRGNKVPLTWKKGSDIEHADALVEETACRNICYKGEWIWGGHNPCRQNLFFSRARHIFIMNLFPVYHKPISARRRSPQQQRNPHFHALLNTPCLSAALPFPCITVLIIISLLSLMLLFLWGNGIDMTTSFPSLSR